VRVAVTGATGLIGSRLVAALRERGDDVTILSRDPAKGVAWDALAGPAPAEALAGRDGVVNLAGEPVAQRWSAAAKERIRASREVGTKNLVAGLLTAEPRPRVLVSACGVDYYGPRGDEEVDESVPPGDTFLADVCRAWEEAAIGATAAGVRVAVLRTGVVLDPHGGALAKMLPPFKLGVGGPVAGGRQWMPWIHLDDIVGMYLAALDRDDWAGPINAVSPNPVTNRDFSRALGRALHRPAVAPVPALALRVLYGDMAEIVTSGRRAVPRRALQLGYAFRHPDLDEALRSALGS
jgi:uncharacterized protein (TIGR01777 family)